MRRVAVMMAVLVMRLLMAGESEEVRRVDRLGIVREKLVSVYQRQLPEPEAGLVAGVVLGHKLSLSEDFKEALVETGTIHVVVASGYNVVVVGSVVLNLLLYLMKRSRATIGAIIGMSFYALLAGGEPPVVRAVIMAGLVFWARAIGRASATWWLLFLAVWSMLMIEPGLLNSISFQLSVAATAGMIWLEPWIRELFEGRNKLIDFLFRTELSPSLAAQVTTAPLIWWYFGRLSLISPLVNVLVLPLVPMIMVLGAAQLFLAVWWHPLALAVAPFTYSVAHLFVIVVQAF